MHISEKNGKVRSLGYTIRLKDRILSGILFAQALEPQAWIQFMNQ